MYFSSSPEPIAGESPSASPSASANPAADWKTYTNTQYGFEFRYPADLNVFETNGTISLESHYNPELYINVVSSTVAKESETIRKEVAGFAGAKLISDDNIIIDGQPAIRIVAYYPESGVQQNIYYFIELKGRVFVVSATPFTTTLTIDQILSTFKFTKPASTVLYRNTQFGLQVSLPQSWEGFKAEASSGNGEVTLSSTGETISIGTTSFVMITHPLSTAQNPRAHIPIRIYTLAQWSHIASKEWHDGGAAPFNSSEITRNSKYVFALPPRYNYAEAIGWAEVGEIISSGAITAF